ncbi:MULTISPECIES: ABC transporter permease subunit [Serratia]|uniref:Peptide ABC transporter permease n=1 Tax=Serratia oryzae TaxID=2034155 RepID=A0A1S8CHK2_9GAMM|nr:ABC transporter permease subunit [Serratia oryzae]OMQ21851.1 peptide ABC transporter permease [Serratia oryzae]VXC95275.1 dipeptide transporter; membrane component of ABC superfamily [Enterobacterales bacterium 8AC]
MVKFIIKRLLMLIPSFIGITLITFMLVHLIPGDPVEIMMGERGLDPAYHAEMLKKLGLDLPLPQQYLNYLSSLLHGDLGMSLTSNESVLHEFLTLFPATLELATLAMILAIIVGIPIGVLAAVKRGSIFDHGVMGLSLTGFSMPIFWWSLILIMFFSVQLGWTPVSGRIDLDFDIEPHSGFMLIDTLIAQYQDPDANQGAFLNALKHLILPAIVLATVPLAIVSRMTRSSMLEVLREDYVRTAYAKGLSPLRVIFGHALRNALIPVLTIIGLSVSSLLGGAVMTETIFSWPGIGKWLIEAIGRRDYQVVQNGILLVATLVILTNVLVDILYGVVNPRIRHA